MPIMGANIIIYVFGALVAIVLAVQIRSEIRLKRILSGKNAKDLEDTILSLTQSVIDIKKREDDIVQMLQNTDERIKSSIRGVELLRFNPFEDAGSNQSFAIALLNENGDGIVLSSLYSRDRMSVFAKPVKSHKSPFELTIEEKEVVKKAKV